MRTPTITFLVFLLFLTVGFPSTVLNAQSAESPSAGEVTVPLDHYLQLRERIERRERETAEPEPALAEVVSQITELRVDDDVASITTVFGVEVRGDYRKPLDLPLTGLPASARVEPAEGAALHRIGEDRLAFVPRQPGAYEVTVEGALDLGSGRRVALAAAGAPVASTRLDLPTDLAWTLPGAVVVDETTEGDRRKLRLALPRTGSHALTLERSLGDDEPDDLLVQAVQVTLVDLDPNGTSRTDMVLYEVLRGEMDTFRISLPDGLEPTAVSTDEGMVTPRREGSTLVVERGRRLDGVGWVAVSGPAPASSRWSLAPVAPTVPVRARYLVLSSQVAARVEPGPADAWSRVDLGDLPQPVRRDVAAFRPSTAWRWSGGSDAMATLDVDPLPAAALGSTLIRRRETTSLWTPEGSLVHQDRFEVERGTTALTVTLAPDVVPWSASVDGVEVRPVVQGNRLSVPLSFQGDGSTEVEIVTLEERPLPDGRDELTFAVASVDLPVLDHHWRLLLAENRRYRFEEGTLAQVVGGRADDDVLPTPTQTEWTRAPSLGNRRAEIQGWVHGGDGSALPGVSVYLSPGDRSAITDERGMFRLRNLDPGRYRLTAQLIGFQTIEQEVVARAGEVLFGHVFLPLAEVMEEIVVVAKAPVLGQEPAAEYRSRQQNQKILSDEAQRIHQGLVGGVKPLPVEIPESGKVLVLSGALPPPEVSVTLRVKGG